MVCRKHFKNYTTVVLFFQYKYPVGLHVEDCEHSFDDRLGISLIIS